MSAYDRELVLGRLRRSRPRERFARASAVALGLLVAWSWWAGDFAWSHVASERRLANVRRFLGELVPYPLQGEPWDWGTAFAWAGEVLADKGFEAVVVTFAISVVAIVLAAAVGAALAPLAARTVATPEPWIGSPRRPGLPRRLAWSGIVWTTRSLFVLLRSLPEYVWAFLLIGFLGPSPWPAILALALHNAGILGKLDAEVAEDLPPAPPGALAGLGARRAQLAVVGVLPSIFPRLLLFFFYRWETCVREATVLGMLGIVSLGFWIADARARNHYDVMFFLVLLGAALVLAGDLVSFLAREAVRREE